MGALTARYLSHLLETGYFDEIEGVEKRDRSSLIASITSLSGAHNGSLVVNNIGMEYSDDVRDWEINTDSFMMKAMRKTVICQNLLFSQNRQMEVINKEIKDDQNQQVYELGYCKNWVFYDLNAESFNWNRLDNETRLEYVKRINQDKFLKETKDVAFYDLCPSGAQKLNTTLKTNPQTYYFSITAGF